MVEEQIQISMDDIEGVDIEEDDIQDLQEKVERCVDTLEEFEEEIDWHMSEINDSKVYKELGIELHVDLMHEFSIDEREE